MTDDSNIEMENIIELDSGRQGFSEAYIHSELSAMNMSLSNSKRRKERAPEIIYELARYGIYDP